MLEDTPTPWLSISDLKLQGSDESLKNTDADSQFYKLKESILSACR